MSAAAKRTVLAVLTVAAVAVFSTAGSAGGAPWKRDRVPPTTPANVHVTSATPSTVSIEWDPSQDNIAVVGYMIYSGTDVYQRTGRSVVTNPAYTLAGLDCGQSVTVLVAALDRAGNRSERALATVSTAACQDTEPPTTPSGFSQSATAQAGVVLRWNPSADNVGVVGYGVYRNLVRVASPTDSVATLSGLACGTGYTYQVDAVDAAGNRSAIANAFVQTASCADQQPPSPPANLAATAATQSSITVSWSPSTDNVDVAGYHVRVDGVLVSTLPQTSLTVSNLACGKSHAVAVDAFDPAGNQSTPTSISAATDDCDAPPPPAPPPPSGDTTPPSTPIGLAASAVSQTGLTLTWVASTDNVAVTGYDVYRNGTKIASLTTTSSSQAGLACGTAYTFGVVARDAAGNSSSQAQLTASTAACVTPPPPPPSPPPADTTAPSQPGSLAIASATGSTVALSWTASTDNVGVTSYGVYRNGSSVATISQPGATVTGLTCGTAYAFQVDAADAAGNRSTRASVTGSTAACADTQPPSAPASVVASSRTATSIALTWLNSTDNVGVAGYGLFRNGTATGTTSTNTGIFAGLTCNTNYTLAVDAFDAAGNHSQKTTVMVSTTACPDTTPPSTPGILRAANVTQTGLDLAWNASSDNVGVTAYDVYRNGTKMATVTTTSSAQTGLACGTSYAFSVVARDAAGNSSAPAQLSVVTSACAAPPPPPPPSGGTTLYVSSSGSDAASCTQAAPCRSLGRAFNLASAGATVLVASGNYPGETLGGDRGGLVTFKAQGTATFTQRVTITGAKHLRLEGFAFQTNDTYWDLLLDACNADVTLVNSSGRRWKMLEGNDGITFQGGSWGGYGAPGEAFDSGFGTAGATGPTRSCSGQTAAPARNVVIDGVTFHDIFWGKAPSEWGGAHPDCLEINGYVDGITIRNSQFLRCGDSFMGLYTDQGDLRNITIQNNVFRDLGNYTWFGIQLVSGGGFNCGNITFTGNTFEPNNPGALDPYSAIRTECHPSGGLSQARVVNNVFQEGPGSYDCQKFLSVPTSWDGNQFTRGQACGTNAS